MLRLPNAPCFGITIQQATFPIFPMFQLQAIVNYK